MCKSCEDFIGSINPPLNRPSGPTSAFLPAFSVEPVARASSIDAGFSRLDKSQQEEVELLGSLEGRLQRVLRAKPQNAALGQHLGFGSQAIEAGPSVSSELAGRVDAASKVSGGITARLRRLLDDLDI